MCGPARNVCVCYGLWNPPTASLPNCISAPRVASWRKIAEIGEWLLLVFITTTTVCVSELNMVLVYPTCSKYKYNASEADCRTSARFLFPSVHTSLSLSLCVCSVQLSVKTQICCFSNFTCKYSRNHSTAIVFILCVAYLILSDDGSIINL